ncbi:cupin domain-containing protein [Amnibacterium kyonggiense]|uniref:DUF985 domain-containing protein n=1 Tax=Amnibacterium kyonggiense TaxID=595671 RepID=A0A4R7FQE5_9MICO|nr:cupin domain-containing protein [Amnibacterium kyonggiense]TDS80000.1 hypothetical protein CLV52_0548 [Amnibacterium kyonggiense]
METAAARAERWIAELGLEPLSGESGWWCRADESALPVRFHDVAMPAFSSIYYLLDPRRPVNVWHRLDSDDTHVLIDGGPVEYVFLRAGHEPSRHVLGRDLRAGQVPMLTAPGGTWKALRLLEPDGFALMATIVTPAWTEEGVRIGLPVEDARRWSGSAPWLTDEVIALLGEE